MNKSAKLMIAGAVLSMVVATPAMAEISAFTAITVEKNGFYGKYGTFGDDFDGDYFEFGYGTEIGGFDAGVYILFNDKDLDLETGDGTESIVFSISKSFSLMD